MKYISLLLLWASFAAAQTNVAQQVDSLRFVDDIPYMCYDLYTDNPTSPGCAHRLFWNVVKLKGDAIPHLIGQLDNMDETPASFPNQGGQCTVADIAYIALREIIHGIPTAELLGVNPDDYVCGYCYYHQNVATKRQRKKFKKAVAAWYEANKAKLVWVTDNSFETCDCDTSAHPNGGHFAVMERSTDHHNRTFRPE